MRNTVVIDCFPESAARYPADYAIVAIDVIRATTTAITAAAAGRRCFPVPTLEAALALARMIDDPLLIGEQQGFLPAGFDLNNSPSELLARDDIERPAILLSSTGTGLCHEASKRHRVFLACLRNYVSVVGYLAGRFPNVAVIGAGNGDEFREEDQLCCAWIAERLLESGYAVGNTNTREIIRRWSNKPVDAWINSKSVAYLRTSRQLDDLEFILTHVADLTAQFTLQQGEVIVRGYEFNSAPADWVSKGISGAGR
jgi:2-phosphosulfolactate phosphatase